MRLIIGNKRYSSWSFRPWLLLKQAGIPFQETRVWLRQPQSLAKIRRYCPAGRVPVLLDSRAVVWESSAICEYLAEKFPGKRLWPDSTAAKAQARSIVHEMHAGFQALRANLPCHFVNRYRGFVVPAAARDDIARIQQIWRGCRRQARGGPFLFGRFSVADAMYAPVVFRFLAYGVRVHDVCREYMRTIESLPATRQWVEAARHETPRIADYEMNLPLHNPVRRR